MEKIAIETQEDLDRLADWLQARNVDVLRPNTTAWQSAHEPITNGNVRHWLPPVAPRDAHIMIGNKFHVHDIARRSRYGCEVTEWPGWQDFYNAIKDPTWPDGVTDADFHTLSVDIQQECINHGYFQYRNQEWFDLTETKKQNWNVYDNIYESIRSQGNPIIDMSQTPYASMQYHIGGLITRLGHNLFFGSMHTDGMTDQENQLADWICEGEWQKNCILTGGHSDATYCPVAPGLIITYYDKSDFDHSQFSRLFPGWEIVYGDDRSTYEQLPDYRTWKKNGYERWLIPSEADNPVLRDFIDVYLSDWIGNASETRFFVNFLMVDPHTAVVAHEDKKIIRAMERYGITCHVMPLRHLFFWDAGIHCSTLDLDRDGIKQSHLIKSSEI
jgi:hypothetical protein